MQINVDENGRVLVCFEERGPFLVIDRDGTVTEEYVERGDTVYTSGDEPDGTYDDGYADAVEDAEDALRDLRSPRRQTQVRTVDASALAAAAAGRKTT